MKADLSKTDSSVQRRRAHIACDCPMQSNEPAARPADGTDEVPDELMDVEGYEQEEISIPPAFSIQDDLSAAWLVRKVTELRSFRGRVRAWADRELRKATRDEEWLLRRFGPELEGWLRSELARRGGRRRSIALPPGTVGLRVQPARLNVLDETQAGAWCLENLPESVRVTVEAEGQAGVELVRWCTQHKEYARMTNKVIREPLARYVNQTGELPSGVEVIDAEDRLYLK